MYFQVAGPVTANTAVEAKNRFVLNPSFQTDDGSYETYDETIKVLVTNKKDIGRFCKECFGGYRHTYDRKIGAFNQFVIELLGPIIKYNGMVVDDPPYEETQLFGLFVERVQITNKNYRSKLLASWVLGLEHPTQFNKILKRDFDVADISPDTVYVAKKILDEPRNTEGHPETSD